MMYINHTTLNANDLINALNANTVNTSPMINATPYLQFHHHPTPNQHQQQHQQQFGFAQPPNTFYLTNQLTPTTSYQHQLKLLATNNSSPSHNITLQQQQQQQSTLRNSNQLSQPTRSNSNSSSSTSPSTISSSNSSPSSSSLIVAQQQSSPSNQPSQPPPQQQQQQQLRALSLYAPYNLAYLNKTTNLNEQPHLLKSSQSKVDYFGLAKSGSVQPRQLTSSTLLANRAAAPFELAAYLPTQDPLFFANAEQSSLALTHLTPSTQPPPPFTLRNQHHVHHSSFNAAKTIYSPLSGVIKKKRKRRYKKPLELRKVLPKNSLMMLHEFRPNVEYRFVCQSGPIHRPTFTMCVDINEHKFEGVGKTKKEARIMAAEKAVNFLMSHPELIQKPVPKDTSSVNSSSSSSSGDAKTTTPSDMTNEEEEEDDDDDLEDDEDDDDLISDEERKQADMKHEQEEEEVKMQSSTT